MMLASMTYPNQKTCSAGRPTAWLLRCRPARRDIENQMRGTVVMVMNYHVNNWAVVAPV